MNTIKIQKTSSIYLNNKTSSIYLILYCLQYMNNNINIYLFPLSPDKFNSSSTFGPMVTVR